MGIVTLMTRRTIPAVIAAVVGRSAEPRVVREERSAADLVRAEEQRLITAHEDAAPGRRYGDAVRDLQGILARVTALLRRDELLVAVLTVVGELEVLLEPTAGGSRLVSALALPLATLPFAWRRRLPLLPLAALALVLPLQAAFDGYLVGQSVTPLVALVLALYSAGRYAAGVAPQAGLVAALVATRFAFDPEVNAPADVVLTLLAVPLPLLVGRWVRGQVLLQRELRRKSERRERERERDARHAAEEERIRIATDLQTAVDGGLSEIVGQARELPGLLAGEDHTAARALLANIADRAREALADVRRVLGVLRHEGRPPPLAPTVAGPRLLDATGPPAQDTSTVGPAGAAAADAPPRDALPRASRRDRLLDRVLVVTLLAGAEIELVLTAPGGHPVLLALTPVAIVIPLLWRRTRPLPAAAAALAAVSLQSTVLGLEAFPVVDIVALMCASYAVGAHAERRLAVAGLVLVALGVVVHAAVFHPDAIAQALLGGGVAPWIVGRTVRGRRLLSHELRERAALIEHAREQDARDATTAARMRVARELHDAVAHNISVIAIQAAGAGGIVDRDPARAAQCAAVIEAAAREALAELGRLAGSTDADASPPAPSQASLARVDALAMRARDAGLPVSLRVEGEPAVLPAGVDLAAYRIVQEALANAAKHAGGTRAWVVVRYREQAVEVEIGDDGRGADAATVPGSNGGHGLIGMRERVALFGGTLQLGPRPSGGFTVHARLPTGRR
jgi:signal transduction histidine kinase